MNFTQDVLFSAPFLALLRLTVLLALAWLTHSLLRQSHPRWRLILWRSVLCISLAVVAAAGLPRTSIRIPIYLSPLEPEPITVPGTGASRPAAKQIGVSGATTTTEKTSIPTHAAPARSGTRAESRWSWQEVVAAFWLIGLAIAGFRLLRLHLQLARLRNGTRPADEALRATVALLRVEMAVKADVSVGVAEGVVSPFVCGLVNPTIILPVRLVENIAPEELEALLRHELAHVGRHDVLWNLAWRWLTAFLWFHPLAWRVAAAHSLACEQQADRAAAVRPESQKSYPEMLARLALRILRPPSVETKLTLNGAAEIVRRLDHLAVTAIRPWSRWRTAAAYSLVVILLMASAGWELSRSRAATPTSAGKVTYKELLVVVKDDEGKPLQGTIVQPYAFRVKGPKAVDHYGWNRSRPRTHITDELGQTHIRYPVEAFPEENLYTDIISVVAKHPDFTPKEAHLRVEGALEPILLTPGIRLEVKPVTVSGEPVAEAVPNLSGEPRAAWKTNEDGTLACHQIAAGPYLLQLMGRLPSGEIGYSEAFAFVAAREKDGDVIEFRGSRFSIQRGKSYRLTLPLKPGLRVEGHVDRSVPRPVTNGRVVVSVRPPQFPALLVAEDLGDLHKKNGNFHFWTSYRAIEPDGSFVFESVPPGELDAIVLGDGFVSRNGGEASNRAMKLTIGVPQVFPLRAATNSIEVVTEKTATLQVAVKTSGGAPVAGAKVYAGPNIIRLPGGIFGNLPGSSEKPFRALPLLPETPPDYIGRTDDQGKVVMANIPALTDRLDLEHPNFQIPVLNGWSRSVRFHLKPGEVQKVEVSVQPKGKDHLGDIKKK